MPSRTLPKPTPQPKRRRRWPLLVLVLLLLVGSLSWLGYARAQRPLPTLQAQTFYSPNTSGQTVTLAWPSYGQSAVGATDYGVLASNGDQKAVPIASLAKLITALAVLKVKPLTDGQQGPTLTLSQADVDLYNSYVAKNGSVVPVTVGEQLSEYQALQAMLLPSANNMADTLAIWAFGSLAAYSTYANHMVTGLGMTHTHIGSDASGLSPDTTSTATDMMKLGQTSATNPVVAGIVAQPTATIPVAGVVKNVNHLLGTDGINGLKTGNSDQAGGTFLFSALYNVPGGPTITIIGVVLGAPTLNQAMNSSLALLTSSQKAFTMTNGLLLGQAVGVYTVPWELGITAITTQALPALAWQGTTIDKPTVTLSPITAPHDTTTPVGRVSFSTSHVTSSVVLSRPLEEPSLNWRVRR